MRLRRAWAARATVLPLVLLLAACGVGDAIRGLAKAPPTAYERYAQSLVDAGLANSALGRDWLTASDSALLAPLAVTLPFHELAYYSRAEARAVAYRLSLREGERLSAVVRAEGLPVQLFLDLFEETADTTRRFVHRATADTATGSEMPRDSTAVFSLGYEIERTGMYILRLQPELLRSGRLEVTVRVEPTLAFPVEGRGNDAVQSLFGVDRDAGRRRHQGIDIFAPRGTPALAATDGVVRSTSPNELGGKVVWLSDGSRSQTLYYAHLDSQAVSPGERVRIGDTLGFVGNTGNARTTRPHLHFGIYRRGSGAVDPYPFVRRVSTPPPAVAVDTARLGTFGRATAAGALLIAPTAGADTVSRVARNTLLQFVGAAGRWYRVQLADGSAGYLPGRATAATDRRIDDAAAPRTTAALDAFGFPVSGGER
jgi:peptidoglycan LD-endopeptidase LytH